MEQYLKAKIDEFETNSKITNIRDWHRGISDVKKGCEPGTNRGKEENDDLVTDSIVFWLGGGTISLIY
jgi:hypothetical protein